MHEKKKKTLLNYPDGYVHAIILLLRIITIGGVKCVSVLSISVLNKHACSAKNCFVYIETNANLYLNIL